MSQDPVDDALKYALRIEGAENLSPNEKHILALAKEVQRLRLELKHLRLATKANKS
jgi:hypothetical protein